MTVIANGVKQTVNRPGWQVTAFTGTAPTKPVQATQGSLSPEFAKLEALRPQPGAGDPDQAVQSSGFDAQNSGRGPSSGLNGGDPNNLGDANNAITGVNNQTQKPTFIPQPKTVPTTQGGNQFGR